MDLTQYANNQADEGMESNRGGEYFLEQKVTKIRIDGQYTKVYDAPYFDISQPLPQIIQSLADTIQIKWYKSQNILISKLFKSRLIDQFWYGNVLLRHSHLNLLHHHTD